MNRFAWLAASFYGVVLAVFASLAIAGLLGATGMGFVLAAVIGLVIGFSADFWAQYV